MNYTTALQVKQDMLPSKDPNTLLANAGEAELNDLISSFSRAIDSHTLMNFGPQTIVAKPYRTIVDNSGTAIIYTDVPLINTLSLVEYRVPQNDSRTWQPVTIDASVDIFNSNTGSRVKLNYPNFHKYRNQLQIRLTMNTGYQTTAAIPADLEFACRRLVIWQYALRTAPLGMLQATDIIAPVPLAWPNYIRNMIGQYKQAVSSVPK